MAEQEQQKQEPVYLFISQSCQHCIDLIKQIQQKDILAKLVQVVAVENAPKLPPGVTKVPSILVNGQIKTGNDCFTFVENYGELDASPTYTNSSGFESEGFSYLGSDGGGDGGTDSFSFLGASNGMEGADMSQADAAYKQEQGQKQKGNGAESMDNITAQRNQDMNQMQGGRR
jgi:hypothetical protein